MLCTLIGDEGSRLAAREDVGLWGRDVDDALLLSCSLLHLIERLKRVAALSENGIDHASLYLRGQLHEQFLHVQALQDDDRREHKSKIDGKGRGCIPSSPRFRCG